jgi:undecaprenyl-diphosphatase
VIALTLLLERIPDFAALCILALLQGLTEFLPVSSSGHLVLAQSAMRLEEPALTIDIALHLGTLVAVLLVYRKDLLEIVRDAVGFRLREVGLLFVGSIPAALVGLLLRDTVREVFKDPINASGGLLATAAILLLGERARRRQGSCGGTGSREEMSDADQRPLTFGAALIIGVAQGLAIWPGISRSGSTIATGMLCGLSPKRAARFSFLLAIPAIGGAALLEVPDLLEGGLGGQGTAILWAALFAAFVGWGALRMLLTFLGRGAFVWFAVYCVALGSGTLLFL